MDGAFRLSDRLNLLPFPTPPLSAQAVFTPRLLPGEPGRGASKNELLCGAKPLGRGGPKTQQSAGGRDGAKHLKRKGWRIPQSSQMPQLLSKGVERATPRFGIDSLPLIVANLCANLRVRKQIEASGADQDGPFAPQRGLKHDKRRSPGGF